MPALSELSRWGTFWDGGTQRLHQVAKFYEEEKELFNSLNSVWSSESLLTLPGDQRLLTLHPQPSESKVLSTHCT